MRPSRPLGLTVAVLTAFSLTACSGAEPGEGGTRAEESPAPDDFGPGSSESQSDDPAVGTPAEEDEERPEGRPGPGECMELDLPDGDVWTVADAGTVTIRVEDDRLVLEEVESAAGWSHEVTEESDDEIEIDFRDGAEEYELEVELEDSEVRAEFCGDR